MAHNRHKNYNEEFRRDVVRLSETSDRSIGQIAQELGISPDLIYKWRQRYLPAALSENPTAAAEEDLAAENRRLRKELERVTQEREILKKVLAMFSRDLP